MKHFKVMGLLLLAIAMLTACSGEVADESGSDAATSSPIASESSPLYTDLEDGYLAVVGGRIPKEEDLDLSFCTGITATFDDNNMCLEAVYAMNDPDGFSDIRTYRYDSEGRTISRKWERNGQLRAYTEYNAFGEPTLAIDYEGGIEMSRREMTYDEQGRRLRELTSSEGRQVGDVYYEYRDGERYCYKSVSKDPTGEILGVSYYTYFEGLDGLIQSIRNESATETRIQTTEYNEEGIDIRTTIFWVDKNGVERETISELLPSEVDGSMIETLINSDSLGNYSCYRINPGTGRVLENYGHDADGTEWEYRYSYFDNHRVQKEEYYVNDELRSDKEYDENGHLIQGEETDENGETVEKTTTTVLANGIRRTETRKRGVLFSAGESTLIAGTYRVTRTESYQGGVLSQYVVFSYDVAGNCVTRKEVYVDAEGNESISETSYMADGGILSITDYQMDGRTVRMYRGQMLAQERLRYDKSDRLTSHVVYEYNEKNLETLNYDKVLDKGKRTAYHPNGVVAREEYFSGGRITRLMVYDAEGNLIEEENNEEGSGPIVEDLPNRGTCEDVDENGNGCYYENGLLVKEVYIDDIHGWRCELSYTYHDNGKKKTFEERHDGVLSNYSVYNEKEILIEQQLFENGTMFSQWFYDDDGRPIRAEYTDSFDGSAWQKTYAYYVNGTLKEEKGVRNGSLVLLNQYDALGRPVSEYEVDRLHNVKESKYQYRPDGTADITVTQGEYITYSVRQPNSKAETSVTYRNGVKFIEAEYDSEGRVLFHYQYRLDGVILDGEKHIYDEENRPLLDARIVDGRETGTRTVYRANGTKVSEEVYVIVHGVETRERLTSYDAEGRLTEDSYYQEGMIVYQERFEYTAKGKTKTHISYDENGVASVSSIETFDLMGHMLSRRGLPDGMYEVWTYFENSDIMKSETIYLSDGTIDEMRTFNKQGDLETLERFGENGRLVDSSRYEYTYHENGQMKTMTRYSFEQKTTFEKYDRDGNLLHREIYG